MAIKSTSKLNMFLSIAAIVCGMLCLFYCIVNFIPLLEISQSFIEVIQVMRGA